MNKAVQVSKRARIYLSPRVDHYDKFDEFVSLRGVEAEWEKSILCLCSDYNKVPDSRCRNCYGRGYMFQPSTSIPVLFTNMEGVPNFMRPGIWVWGVTYVSTQSHHRLAVRDRIRLKDFNTVYLEKAVVNNDQVFLNRPLSDIESIWVYEDFTMQELVKDEDYFLQEGSVILFRDHDQSEVSVRYLSHLSYIVVNLLHEVRGWTDTEEGTVKFPNQYLMQREDFVMADKELDIDDTD